MFLKSQISYLKSQIPRLGLYFLSLSFLTFASAHAAPHPQPTTQLAPRPSSLAPSFSCTFTRDGSAALAALPRPTFPGELCRLSGLTPAPPRPAPPEPEARPDLLDAELRGLREALASLPTTQTQSLLKSYQSLRQPAADALTSSSLNSAIPPEFALYLEGVLAARDGDTTRALQRWGALLALPEPERRHRSVWAAYMIGRAGVRTDPAGAVIYLEECRRLAASGFADPLGLAPASLAWQIRAEIEAGQFARAMNHLLAQPRLPAIPSISSMSSISSTSSTASSVDLELLEEICVRAADSEDLSPLDDLALSPAGRPVMTAFLFTQSASGDPTAIAGPAARWLKAVAELGGQPAPPEAEDLAALARNLGDADAARRWAAPGAVADSRAFQAQLAAVLRDGPTDRLLAEVGHSCREWPITPTTATEHSSPANDLSALLSAIHLARGEFLPALQTALDAGRWNDAAFLAEYVLTTAELSSICNPQSAISNPQLNGKAGEDARAPGNSQSEILTRLHHLLARRLAREGDLVRVRPHFAQGAPALLPEFDKLIRDRRIAAAPGVTGDLRASALLEAGLITRRLGLALYGTELAPDWALYNGRPGGPDPALLRLQTTSTLAPSPAERARILGARTPSSAPASLNSQLTTHHPQPSSPIPHSAFRIPHFLGLAADLLWSAAGLLPDNDPRLAAALWHGGRCLAAADPAAADKFYKALARRCAGLPIGREAARRRWFPPDAPPPAPPLALPAVIYAAPAGDDRNDGASWAAPKRTLAAALATARLTGAPVWAAAGIYPETLSLNENDNGLALLGGFRGGETSPAQRRPGTDALTILDASAAAGRALTLDALTSATFDGLLVRGGDARGPGDAGNGGGVFCRAAGPGVILRNCIIAQNHAASHGGGIYLEAASPTITSCSLAANRADAGGGGLAAFSGSRPSLEGCVFAGNGARFGPGGALYLQDSAFTIFDCRFGGNWAESGGAACADLDSTISLLSCTLATTHDTIQSMTSMQSTSSISPPASSLQPPALISSWTSVPYYNPQTGLTALVDRRADFSAFAGRHLLLQPDGGRPTVALVLGVRGATMLEVLGDFTRATAQGRSYRLLDAPSPALPAKSSRIDITPPFSLIGPLSTTTSAAALSIPFTYHDDRSPMRRVRLFYRKDCGPWRAGDAATSPTQTLRFNAARLGPGRYDFYTRATDAASNTEPPPPRPGLSITVGRLFEPTIRIENPASLGIPKQ